MAVQDLDSPPRSSYARTHDLALWVTSTLFLSFFIGLSLRAATRNPLYVDEIYALWVARLPSVSQIVSAIMHGSEFSPPTYHLLLHFYSLLAGDSSLALRFPSLLAELLVAFFSFSLFRRYLGMRSAAFACCLILEAISPFGLQIRPYALVTACFAAVLLLWDGLESHYSRLSITLIGILLAFAGSLHFYAILFVPCVALIELFRLQSTRQFRWSLWLSLAASGASIFIWLPLIRAITKLNAADSTGSAYGPSPTLDALVSMYSYLFRGLANPHLLGNLGINASIVLIALCFLPFGKFAENRLGRFLRITSDVPSITVNRHAAFWAINIGVILFPAIVFLFSYFVTKTFNLRYVIAGSIGASAILTETLGGFPLFRPLVPLLLFVATCFTFLWGIPSMHLFDHSTTYGFFPGSYPVVAADGNEFFQLEEGAPPNFRARLVYLVVPPSVPVGDPTDEHEVIRWKVIDPKLPVEDATAFLANHPKFYVLDERTADDTPARYLLSKGYIEPWKQIGGAVIYRSRPSDASNRW
jgi:hypothetical protein